MSDIVKKIVDFTYCNQCKHKNLKDTEDPCNYCLTQNYNDNSILPVSYDGPRPEPVKGRRDMV